MGIFRILILLWNREQGFKWFIVRSLVRIPGSMKLNRSIIRIYNCRGFLFSWTKGVAMVERDPIPIIEFRLVRDAGNKRRGKRRIQRTKRDRSSEGGKWRGYPTGWADLAEIRAGNVMKMAKSTQPLINERRTFRFVEISRFAGLGFHRVAKPRFEFLSAGINCHIYRANA